MTDSYTVFISSTYLDNKDRRKIVEEAILRAGMRPVGMERFGASTNPSVDECVRMAGEADLLLGIIVHRYGWIPLGYDVSITELEYNAAHERLMFLQDDNMRFDTNTDFDIGTDKWDKQKMLDAFKSRISIDQMPGRFNDTNLGTVVSQSLNDWKDRKRRGETAVEKSDIEAEIRNYLVKIESLHASLPMAGFSTKLRVPIDLADLYVPLRAMVDLRSIGEAKFADAKHAELCLGMGDRQELSLPDAFKECEKRRRQGFVILGDPGAGKTTHLKRVVVACCRDGASSLGLPSNMVPVFLPLRELKDPGAGLAAFIQAQLDKNVELGTGPDFGKRLIARKNLLILLDGLDEILNEKDRKQVAQWIETARTLHPECRFVVTCRYAGYSEAVRLDANFLELHIRPLSDEQVESFVRNWYRIVEQGMAMDKDQAAAIAKKQADKLVARLRAPDFQARRVYELTANPLLLANLCLVHRDRGELPKRRAQLYSECVDVLLERWRSAKDLPLQVTADEGRRVLQPAALLMHEKENRTRVSATDLTSVIAPALQSIQWKGGGASDFLNTIRDESGLLTGWGDGTFGFMHLGFQEYLAAREIRMRALSGDADVIKQLANKFGESWWQEVTLLLLALEEPSMFERLMREVIKNGAFTKHPELVEMCLDDAAQVSDKPFVELLKSGSKKDYASQIQSLRIMERLSPKVFDELLKDLSIRSLPEIEAWIKSRAAGMEHKVIIAEPSGVELVQIPPGEFWMGSSRDQHDAMSWERPMHRVKIPGFCLSKYPVTNQQYARFMQATQTRIKPEYWGDRRFNQSNQPVVGVSWNEARAYCDWAELRLPSEAEWEYACRAGSNTKYSSGDSESDLARIAWYSGNSENRLHPVGEKEPNAFGLYDMQGNVWEWVEDDWHGGYDGAPENGSAWFEKVRPDARGYRGGSWNNLAGHCRPATRTKWSPRNRDRCVGFRPARSIP